MSGIETEEVACNLCGGRDADVLFESRDGWPVDGSGHYAATTDRFGAYGTIRKCRACGLCYTSPRVKAGRLLEEYAAAEDSDYCSAAESRSINAYFSLATLRRHATGGRLLEIGCSTGFFLNAARVYFDVAGVEPSSWARKFASEHLRLDIAAATLEEARFPDASFDAAAAIDVIEHLADPAAVLREAARVVKKGGVLYIVTPDIESLSASLLRASWWGLRPAHVYYFSRETLTRMLDRCGFDVVDARSYGRIFTWGYWFTRLAGYPKPVSAAVGAAIHGLGIENKFLYIDTRDSIQVVARRR